MLRSKRHFIKIKIRILLILIAGVLASSTQAQQDENHIAPVPVKKAEELSDSNHSYKNFADFFRKGEFEGHGRYFFMATDNSVGLTDAHAHAFGMGIGYRSPQFYGFTISMSGFFIYNLNSSNLAAKDPVTGQRNRYEIGLFDVQNPHNHHDLDRLEDLNIQYKYKGLKLKFGKQHINSVFINPQDGRMRPTLVEGFTVIYNKGNHLKFHGGWLYGVSPRSTVKWFQIGNSVGIYPVGLSANGTPSQYYQQVKSKWLQYAGIEYKPVKSVRLFLWNQYFDNVNNTMMFQPEWIIKAERTELFLGAQYIRQNTTGDGGNEDASLRYAEKGSYADIFGGRLEYRKPNRWSIQLNFTNIGSSGRYLMPREWGRDPFFTFMPRERNEGFGDVKAINLVLSAQHKKLPLFARLGAGRYDLPDPKNAALNKYGFPSYYHYMAEVKYKPKGFMEGLQLMLLTIYKQGFGETGGNLKYVYNKVDLFNYNLIVQYSF